ncbi:MAG: ATP-binding cassette domain-containing protein, partial [Paludibacteraceae bacterium]|nr:ATP-binding cassette domain-containing protein [Paludibacteraceae bacterium]
GMGNLAIYGLPLGYVWIEEVVTPDGYFPIPAQKVEITEDTTFESPIEFFQEDPACKKIVQRLKPLQDVGIGYIQLGQSSSTLSGGESQRVKLASFLAQENQAPTIFVFDEPTTGLSHSDIQVLLHALNQLISKGHTVIVIEHNASVILAADHVIDLGPEGGEEGGHLVFEGTPEELAQCEESYTGRYIKQLIK